MKPLLRWKSLRENEVKEGRPHNLPGKMAMKKIWIMNHYASDMYRNKAGRHYWFARILSEREYEPIIFCANTFHNTSEMVDVGRKKMIVKQEGTIPYIFVKTVSYTTNGFNRLRNMICFFLNLFPAAKQCKKMFGKPDVIFASSVHPLTLVAGILIAKNMKVPCICEIRDLWPESLVSFGIIKKTNPILKMLYQGEKWLYKKADAVIFTMEGGAQYLIDKGWDRKIDMSKIFHINNGVDLKLFDSNREKYQLEDSDLNNEQRFKVVYAGSIRHTTNILQVVKAAEELKNTDIIFLIYGDGNQREELEKYCVDNDINNVKFKGRVDNKFIPYILSKSNLNLINVHPTDLWLQYGSSENKLFEYLAGAKPICSNIKVNYSITERFDCGVDENITDAKRYAEIIKEMKDMDQERYNQLCRNARKAAEEYDFHALVDKLEQIIAKCLQD